MKKINYKESDVFAVPLRNGGYGLGVVSRISPTGKIVLGYFFGQKFWEVPSSDISSDLKPSEAIAIVRFGDLSLIRKEWPVITSIMDWDRSRWGSPKFIRKDDLSRRAWEISYDDNNPGKILGEKPCSFEESRLWEDGLYGSGAVELMLTDKIG